MNSIIDKAIGFYQKNLKIILTVLFGIVAASQLSSAIYISCIHSNAGSIVGQFVKVLLVSALFAIPAAGAWLKKDNWVKVGLSIILGYVLYANVINLTSTWSSLTYFSSYSGAGTKMGIIFAFFFYTAACAWAGCSIANFLFPKNIFKVIIAIAGCVGVFFHLLSVIAEIVEWIELGNADQAYYVLSAILTVAYFAALVFLPLVFKFGGNKEEPVVENKEESVQVID